jgi:HEPN domain-containing protein
MPNKTYALEWLNTSKRNLETAILLLSHNHYTDVIAIDIHQTIEKAFKAVYAYCGINIPRTHSLLLLFEFVKSRINLIEISDDDILIISDYYESDRYPGPKYFFPSSKEITIKLELAKKIVSSVEKYIEFHESVS